MPLPRPRVSLLTLMFLMTLVAMALALWKLNSELAPLRQEVKRLRSEVGELYIEDPTKLHAIRVETKNELEWKWRIWFPKGSRYRIRAHGGPVSVAGYPSNGGTITHDRPGEYIVRYLIRRDPHTEKWYGSLRMTGKNGSLRVARTSVGKDEQPWIEWPRRIRSVKGVSYAVKSFDKQQTVDLFRVRVSKDAKDLTKIKDPAVGFMIWIEPVP